MPQKTVDLDSPVTSDSEASEPVKGIKRTNSSVDDKKDKGPKKLKGNEIETVEGLAFWKKNKDSGVVPFHRLETGKWFQVPKGNIPKAQKNPPARLEYQVRFFCDDFFSVVHRHIFMLHKFLFFERLIFVTNLFIF